MILQIQKNIEEMAASGHDTTSLDDEAFNLETSLDRGILRLIASCCNGEFLLAYHTLILIQKVSFPLSPVFICLVEMLVKHKTWASLTVSFVLFSGDKLVRATELVKLLSLEKSVRGAIKLVTALKLPNLAERFNNILEVRPESSI